MSTLFHIWLVGFSLTLTTMALVCSSRFGKQLLASERKSVRKRGVLGMVLTAVFWPVIWAKVLPRYFQEMRR